MQVLPALQAAPPESADRFHCWDSTFPGLSESYLHDCSQSHDAAVSVYSRPPSLPSPPFPKKLSVTTVPQTWRLKDELGLSCDLRDSEDGADTVRTPPCSMYGARGQAQSTHLSLRLHPHLQKASQKRWHFRGVCTGWGQEKNKGWGRGHSGRFHKFNRLLIAHHEI